ncbi:MAG: PEP/pyruvate-binding domain-containing protein, partial [Dethiobacteria bacterium]|nr:PEP/pyruvate-binding domain-containing protein [Dethiobacteria bacterium]
MYGQYKEPKFEALGLMYRLEQVASRLIDKILEEVKLEYISAKTLNSIYEVLVLFKTGLELDGMVNQNFNSTLEMFRYSLTSTSVTLSQYMNIFRFMAQHIKELINEYFIRVYDETINVVIPQIFDSATDTVAREAEIFYREILSSAFLIQQLDQFITASLDMINNMLENYSPAHIHNMMTYNPDLAVSPLNTATTTIDNQVFLGAKAYYLKKLIAYGMPIPPGFVLTTEVYRHRETVFEHPYMRLELEKMIVRYLTMIEKATKLKFGSPKKPILLSARSGTAISMPGAMSTFLNIGITDEIAASLGENPETAWMGWDSYRRFIQSWGMSHGIDRDCFDAVMSRVKAKYSVDRKLNFSADQMHELALEYKKTLNDHGVVIVEKPFEQLKMAINNIFESWSSQRAIAYRKHLQIADEWGTAVLVQKMVMGNRSKRSGSGVVFTHNPKLKKPGINLYGDFTLCSQGEDIVAGLVYPLPI